MHTYSKRKLPHHLIEYVRLSTLLLKIFHSPPTVDEEKRRAISKSEWNYIWKYNGEIFLFFNLDNETCTTSMKKMCNPIDIYIFYRIKIEY